MSPSKKKLVVIGDTFCDIIALDVRLPSTWGTDTLTREIKVVAGGSALNITLHAANYSEFLGSEVTVHFFSSTGADFQGHVCRDSLQHPCLDATKVLIDENLRTGSCIVLSGVDDRSFVTDRGCIKDLSSSWFPRDSLLSSSMNHIHIGGFYNCDALQSEIPLLLREARELSMTTSLNPQYDATGKWEGIKELCPYLTFFIANEQELSAVTKVHEGSSIVMNATVLLNWGCEVVVVTLGSKGAILFRKQAVNGECEQSSQISDSIGDVNVSSIIQHAVKVEVVDTTGAGDAFTGGFIIDWIVNSNMSSALHAGCLAGSAAVMHVGGSKYSIDSLKQVSLCSSSNS